MLAPALLVAQLAVTVVSDTGCPTFEAVAGELGRLRPDLTARAARPGAAGPGAGAGDGPVARIARHGTRLTVQLGSAARPAEFERLLEAPAASCPALARTAALVLAGFLVALDDQRLGLPATSAVSPPPPAAPTLTAAPAAPAPPGPGWFPRGLLLSAAYVSSVSPGGFQPGAQLEAAFWPARWPVGPRLAFHGLGLHDESGSATFGPGAGWTRLWFAVGPSFRLAWRRLLLELHAEVLPGLALVQVGSAAPRPGSYTAFNLGAGGGLRVAVKTGPVLPFVGLTGVYWLHRPAGGLDAGGNDPGLLLPDWQLLIAVGVGWDLPLPGGRFL